MADDKKSAPGTPASGAPATPSKSDTPQKASGFSGTSIGNAMNNVCIGVMRIFEKPSAAEMEDCAPFVKEKQAISKKVTALAQRTGNGRTAPISEKEYEALCIEVREFEKKAAELKANHPKPLPYCMVGEGATTMSFARHQLTVMSGNQAGAMGGLGKGTLGQILYKELGTNTLIGLTTPTDGGTRAAVTAVVENAGVELPISPGGVGRGRGASGQKTKSKTDQQAGSTVIDQKSTGKPDKNCQSCPLGGPKPINPIYGSKVLEGETERDFILGGPLPLSWQRSYVSSNADTGWLGQGWSLPIAFRLDIEVDSVVFVDTQGRRTSFPQLAVGQRFFSQYEHTTLQRNARNEYEIANPNGMRLVFGLTGAQIAMVSELEQKPQSAGTNDQDLPQVDVLMLRGMIDANENFIRLVWRTDNLPHHLEDSTGRKIGFHFENDRLTHVFEMHGKPNRDGSYPKSQLESIVEYRYSREGDLIAVLDSTGNIVRTFAYQNHIMVEHAEPGGIVSHYEWDRLAPEGRVTRNTLNTGEYWTFQYDEVAGRTVVTDATARLTIYHFDKDKNFVGLTDPTGAFTARVLDLYGNLIAMIDPIGNTTRYGYDENSTLIRVTLADGAVTKIEYHSQWRKPIAITNALGQTTRFSYDSRGNLIEQIEPDGASTQYQLNSHGLPDAIVDARGGIAKLTYDSALRLASYTDCSGHTTHYDYDKRGNLASVTDPNGWRTEYGYERINRQDRIAYIKYADGAEERLAYDSLGRIIAHHDPLGQVTKYTLDLAGRPILRTNALGGNLRYAYDVHGRLIVLHNENEVKSRFAYDVLDRLTAEQGFEGKRSNYYYGPSGYMVESTENSNSKFPIRSRYKRDAMGRLLTKISIKAKAQENTEFTHLISARNRFEYNELGQLIVARNSSVKVELQYNFLGQVVGESMRARCGHGSMLEHGYDPLGNRIQTILPDGRKLNTLIYGSGHVHQINIDGDVICDMERNALHQEIRRTQGVITSHYERDGLGRLLSSHTSVASHVTAQHNMPLVGNGRSIARQYVYDKAGQLLQSVDNRHGITNYRYDPIGRLRAAAQPNLAESFSFDPAHNLLDLSQQKEATEKKASFTQEEWAALVKANVANPRFNPLQALDEHNNPDTWNDVKANQIKVYQDKRYAYDDYGNTVEKKIGAHTVQHFQWDAEHQLTQVNVTRQGITQQFRYEYDPFGRRFAKHDQFGVTYFTWDGNQLLIEQRGQQQRLYVYESNSFVPLAQVTLDQTLQDIPDANEEIPQIPHEWHSVTNTHSREWKKRMAMEGITPVQLAQEEAENRKKEREERKRQRQTERQKAALAIYYYHTDHLGTPKELTDCNGEIRWSATYKAWGNTLKIEVVEEESSTVPVQQALRFQGQYFDSETGLHYNRFRFFDPDIGKFISLDPIGLAGGENLYQYAPNPTTWIDMLGLDRHQQDIARFRQKAGLPAYNVDDKTTGTVAKAVDCKGKTAYGTNSNFSPDKELRQGGLEGVKSVGAYEGSKNLGQAIFLTHAEAQALLRLKANGGCMSKVTLYVDRPTCSYCKGGLPSLAKSLGVKELNIYSGTNPTPYPVKL